MEKIERQIRVAEKQYQKFGNDFNLIRKKKKQKAKEVVHSQI